jgi:hypothetical protein
MPSKDARAFVGGVGNHRQQVRAKQGKLVDHPEPAVVTKRDPVAEI